MPERSISVIDIQLILTEITNIDIIKSVAIEISYGNPLAIVLIVQSGLHSDVVKLLIEYVQINLIGIVGQVRAVPILGIGVGDCSDVFVRDRITQLDSRSGASNSVIMGCGLVRFQ